MKTTIFYVQKNTFFLKMILFILLCQNSLVYSQTITDYTFSASSGTFTALSGGTSPTLTAGNTDDGYFNALPIGFTFVYMGVPCTTISASTNGWLSPGNNLTADVLTNNIANSGSPRPVLAALWDDIDIQASTNVSYLTTGTIGSRVFTIEYLNTKWNWLSTGTQISFQVKLHEATGQIQYIYRQETDALNAPTASIGITASGTGAGNYLSLNNASASPTASSTVATDNIATKPATNQIYSFTPGATIPNAPTNLTFTNILNTSYTLNWTDASNEDVYNIYSSTDNINFTYLQTIAGNSTTLNVTGLTANTLYYWRVFGSSEAFLSTTSLNGSQLTATAFPITTTGSGSIVIPCGVNSITVETWGAGGGGGSSNNGTARGGSGGGGGAYAAGSHNVTAGSTYFYFVGAGGNGGPASSVTAPTPGTSTWFRATANTNSAPTTNVLGTLADPGKAGVNNSNVIPTNGGTAASSFGNLTTTNALNGAAGNNNGGGNGGNAANTAGGDGTGGLGSSTTDGANGETPGGGGGGSNDVAARRGGNGGNGTMILYYPVYIPNTAPTGVSATVSSSCTGPFSTTLTQTGGTLGTGATWFWYSGSCGGTLIGSTTAANASITLSVSATTTYFVRAEGGACSSTTSCASTTITLNTLSTDPTSATASSTTICNGGSTTLTLNGGSSGTGGVITWYSGSCGGTLIGTGNGLSVSPIANTSYFGRYEGTCNNTLCSSVAITVNTLSTDPTSATASSPTICNGGSTTLTLNGGSAGTGAVITWYSASCGGTLVGTGNGLSVSPTTNTTYFGRYEGTCNNTTCQSVSITVNTLSTNPTSATASLTTICNGGSTTLTLNGGSAGTGGVITWYSTSCGGTLVGTGNGLSVSPTANTTYFGRYEGTCNNSLCSSVSIVVNTLSTNPTSATASSTTICNGGSTTLTLNGGSAGTGGVITWYSASCGGTLVGTGNGLSVSPTANTTYFGRYEGTCNNTTCQSVSITVNQGPTASAGTIAAVFVGDYYTVSGASSTNGTILWTENGAGLFDEIWFPVGNPTTLTPTYYVDEADWGNTVTLTMTVTGLGACAGNTATATVTLNTNNLPGLWHYQCGTTTPYIDEYIYTYATPGATNYRIRIDDGITQEVRTTNSTVFYFRQFASAKYNTTYNCDVDAFVGGSWLGYGPVCQITTPSVPLTNVTASQCGITLATVNTSIFADAIWGVNLYEFSCFDGFTTQTFQTTNRFFNLTQLASYNFSTTYAVTVRTRTGLIWTGFGASCNITTPAQVCQISASQCGTILTNNSTDIYCNAIFGTTIYEFRMVNGGTTLTIQKPCQTFKFSQVSGIVPGVAYNVSVRTFTNGIWTAFGPACSITSSSALASIEATNCGTTLADNNIDIYCLNIPSTTIYEFRLVNGGTTLTIQKPSRTFKFSQVTGCLPSVTYAVSVRTFTNGSWTAFGTACNITAAGANSKITTAQCGSTLTDINTDLYADNVVSATQYRFRVTNSGGTVTIDKPSRTFKLTQLSNVKYGEVNAIDVDVFVNGAWIGYGTSCNVTTPALPTSKIQASQCGITVASIQTVLYADAICGATQYRFRVNGSFLITKTNRLFKLSDIPGLTINTTYAIDVAVFVNGAWQIYGTSCNVTSPGVLALAANNNMDQNQENLSIIDSEEIEYPIAEISNSNLKFEVNVFPNPFLNEFSLDLLSNDSDNIKIEIHDFTGKLVDYFELNSENISKIKFGQNYSNGLYHVKVSQGENIKFVKVIKND